MENNKDAWDSLINRYETITLEEIEKENCKHQKLTGFGNTDICCLCKATKFSITPYDCSKCMWLIYTGSKCYHYPNKKTYEAIGCAATPNDLLQAFRNRAAHMKQVESDYSLKQAYQSRAIIMKQVEENFNPKQ